MFARCELTGPEARGGAGLPDVVTALSQASPLAGRQAAQRPGTATGDATALAYAIANLPPEQRQSVYVNSVLQNARLVASALR